MIAVMRRRRPGAPGTGGAGPGGYLAAVLVGLGLLVGLGVALAPSPGHLRAVVIENPGERAVSVRLRAVDSRASLDLGQVPAGGRAVFEEVLDVGPELMVMLRYGGVSAGELRVPRQRLVEGWVVPRAVTEHFDLRRVGATPG
ncbi:MAG: hypothetical protein GEV08_07860 [Acidimicrobiia bacterium]|nr:hypothetical protein [Acidimicrobiia bacterium]